MSVPEVFEDTTLDGVRTLVTAMAVLAACAIAFVATVTVSVDPESPTEPVGPDGEKDTDAVTSSNPVADAKSLAAGSTATILPPTGTWPRVSNDSVCG